MTDPKLLITHPTICGYLAHWAVRQSPYAAPENFTAAVTAFTAALADDPEHTFGDLKMVRWTYDELQNAVWSAIEAVPEIVQWNEPKSAHGAKFVFSSRYDRPAPDDDFIDLRALCGNVVRSVWADAEREALDEAA